MMTRKNIELKRLFHKKNLNILTKRDMIRKILILLKRRKMIRNLFLMNLLRNNFIEKDYFFLIILLRDIIIDLIDCNLSRLLLILHDIFILNWTSRCHEIHSWKLDLRFNCDYRDLEFIRYNAYLNPCDCDIIEW